MLTDWVLIARLAAELGERLRGGRVRDAGMLNDGRVALRLHSRGTVVTLAIDPFFSPPIATLEDGQCGVTPAPGFGRALADALIGMVLHGVSARRHDRLLKLEFRARSKFGVSGELLLYAELVPRFGNVVLAKGERVIAALKEFPPGAAGRRSILAGQRYELPPLPERPRTLAAAPVSEEWLRRPIHVYRRDGRIVAAYVTPLDAPEGPEHTIEASLLDVFAQLRAERGHAERSQHGERRRQRLFRRLDERDRKAHAELAALSEKRRRAGDREMLRRDGEEIFATLHERPREERATLKDRATALFAEYKKLGKSLPHIELRVRDLTALLASIETLRWEAERARDEDLPDVETAAAQLEPRQKPAKTRAAAPKRRRALE
ncbi:MAG: NFACT family protein, partial [Candidatus Eremiobacteraeota bacterium]|nr:NFACT family protein [Candidatus Eremiobacteraeota bacterium]